MVSKVSDAWKEAVVVAAVVLLAAVLRLGWPGLTEFKADEARLTRLALEMAVDGRFAVRGITSSVGFPNFPMSVWLYALPLLVWPHVFSATLFTGLLNTAAVLGTYWLVRRYWGVPAALTAVLLFAVSPWALHHARKIWAQNLLPFFVVGWGISALLAFADRRPKWIVTHLLCLAVSVQVHFAAAALAPVTALYLLIYRRRVSWRWALVGALLSLLTVLPFVVYLLTDGRRYLTTTVAGGGTRAVSVAALRFGWLLTGGAEIHALSGPQAFESFLAQTPDLTVVHLFWLVLALAGTAVLLWQWRRGPDRQRDAALIVLLWGIGPLIFFSLPMLPVELHYLLPLYPAPYVAAGALVAAAQPGLRRLLLGAVLLSAVAQVWLWGALLSFIATTPTPGGFGVPLARQLAAAEVAQRQMVQAEAREILIAGPGEWPLLDGYPAIFDVLLYDVPRRFVDVRKTAVFPAAPAVALVDPVGHGADLYRQAATETAAVPRRPGEGAWLVLTVPPQAATPQRAFEPPFILANWAAFAGYDDPVYHDDGTATWRVYWYAGEPSGLDFHLFNHLLDAAGERVGQADTAVFRADQWQPGDLVVTHVRLPWPDTAVTVRSGMYTYPDLSPVPVFDAAANPAAEAIEIPIGEGAH